jgi:hypothetical protein
MRAATLLAALLAAPFPAAGQPAAPDEPRFETDLELRVGETRFVTRGPVQRVLCDRGDVVERVTAEEGNGFRALAVGETTCTLTTADGVRRTFHVKVVEKGRQKPGS